MIFHTKQFVNYQPLPQIGLILYYGLHLCLDMQTMAVLIRRDPCLLTDDGARLTSVLGMLEPCDIKEIVDHKLFLSISVIEAKIL